MNREELKQASEDNLHRIVIEGRRHNPLLSTYQEIDSYKSGYRAGCQFVGDWFDKHPDNRCPNQEQLEKIDHLLYHYQKDKRDKKTELVLSITYKNIGTMNREEEIENAFIDNGFIYDEPVDLIKIGAQWADEHPSEETIKKIAIMANQGECQAAPLEKIVEYVKQHWNDEPVGKNDKLNN